MYAFCLAAGAVIYFVYFRHRDVSLNKQDRAAETFISNVDERAYGPLNAPTTAPFKRRPKAYVATVFSPYNGAYHPFNDLSEEEAESEIKSLNATNRFLYG